MNKEKLLLNGDEAVARAARAAGFSLGIGYPGTPSTEILETFSELGGHAEWAPNEKVAAEVAIGAAIAGGRAIVTMKHVGMNVAADPFFTAAYTGVEGALVIVAADDPGMASSQNEQDSRRYAVAAGLPMLEPADSQQCYDFLLLAVKISERWKTPIILRLSTRVCHSKTVVLADPPAAPVVGNYVKNARARVMVPANARPAHRRLRQRLHEIEEWNVAEGPTRLLGNLAAAKGVVATGISAMHAAEALPEAVILQPGLTYPLPLAKIAEFVKAHAACLVVEEGDPIVADTLKAAGLKVDEKEEEFRFGELNVARVKKLAAHDTTPDPAPAPGKPPQLCPGCPHRLTFQALHDLGCTVSGDIGCYTLGVLPPFEAMDTCVCMGASIGVALGMREVLPDEQAKKIVSVIGDSTFMHSGLTGLVDMVYNKPPHGHVVILLDNSTTAMTGLQEHPGTGRTLDHQDTVRVDPAAVARAIGVRVEEIDPLEMKDTLKDFIQEQLDKEDVCLIICKRSCLLALKHLKDREKAKEEAAAQQKG